MTAKKTALIMTGLVFASQVAALRRDERAVSRNLSRFRQQPSGANLVSLLFAEGVLLAELGSLFG